MTAAGTRSGLDRGRFQRKNGAFGACGRVTRPACIGVTLMFGVASALAASAPSFAPPKHYAAKGPISLVIGDLSGDGKPDLATANGTGTISVLVNSGGGRLRVPRGYSAGTDATRLAISDLNGDGKLDLVAASFLKGLVSVLLNSGGGALRPPRRYTVGEYPNSLAMRDLNGDGRPDVAVAVAGDVSVLLNRGDGSFKPRLIYASGGGESIAVTDVNGDRAADVVTEHINGISVFLNRGDGRFRSRQDYLVQIVPPQMGEALATGDLNGDGLADLAVPNYKDRNSCCVLGKSVSVFINSGNGNFHRQRDYRTGRGPESVAIADINGDRKLDVVTVNDASTISLLLGRGDGTLHRALEFRVGTKPYSGNHRFAIGDLNQDTRLDVAIANQGVTTNDPDDNISVLLARTR
jgi:hypothetical protein